MTGLLDPFKSVVKGTAIELFLNLYHDQVISYFRMALSDIKAKEIEGFVHQNKGLPISTELFRKLKGYEAYLERIDPGRLFEWIAEANPEIGRGFIALGDEGAQYIVNLKTFIIDSIKSLPTEELGDDEKKGEQPETPPAEQSKPLPADRCRLTCSDCGESFVLSKEEAETINTCPYCGAPR